jgi:hypothetical protein
MSLRLGSRQSDTYGMNNTINDMTINDREIDTYENSMADDSLFQGNKLLPSNINSNIVSERKFDCISNIKRDQMYRRHMTPKVGLTRRNNNTIDLPKIDFQKINKLRVKNLTNGTGNIIRDELIENGGAAKFFRTKRANNIMNKPLGMWESTHL